MEPRMRMNYRRDCVVSKEDDVELNISFGSGGMAFTEGAAYFITTFIFAQPTAGLHAEKSELLASAE